MLQIELHFTADALRNSIGAAAYRTHYLSHLERNPGYYGFPGLYLASVAHRPGVHEMKAENAQLACVAGSRQARISLCLVYGSCSLNLCAARKVLYTTPKARQIVETQPHT